MRSILQGQKMVTRYKGTNPSSQSRIHEQTMKAISHLLKEKNITVKKTINIKKVLVPIDDGRIKTKVKNLHTQIHNKEVANVKMVDNVAIKKVNKLPVAKLCDKKRKRNASVVKEQEIKEYYPDYKKRRLDTKKVELKPKPHYKLLGSVNKRKRRNPHKEVPPHPIAEPHTQSGEQLTVEQLVMMADDELTDDDWMEILTCPSPVWWEEGNECDSPSGSDDDYENDRRSIAIESTLNKKETPKTIAQILDELNKKPLIKNSNEITKKAQNENIVDKRLKLEGLLDIIKYKKDDYRDESDGSKNRTNSRNSFSDMSINGDELIESLINIKIPVESTDNDSDEMDIKEVTPVKVESFESHGIKSKNTLIEQESDTDTRTSHNHIRSFEFVNDSVISYNEASTKKGIVSPQKDNKIHLECQETYSSGIDDNDIETIAIPSAHAINVNIESPKSIHDLKLNSKSVECDSISDTNIKYLDEYEDKSDTNNKTSDTADSNEFVTVYKIIGNETELVDIESYIKINLLSKSAQPVEKTLNNFYKKCKKSKSHPKLVKILPKPVKDDSNVVSLDHKNKSHFILQDESVPVRNTGVKYCYKCSSIFEGKTCQYCAKNTTEAPIKIKRNRKPRKKVDAT